MFGFVRGFFPLSLFDVKSIFVVVHCAWLCDVRMLLFVGDVAFNGWRLLSIVRFVMFLYVACRLVRVVVRFAFWVCVVSWCLLFCVCGLFVVG